MFSLRISLKNKPVLLFSALLLLFADIALAQNEISLSIKKVNNVKTGISFYNPIQNVAQISIQRSLDSDNYFTTVYSVQNVKSKNINYTDFYPLSNKEVFYRVLIALKNGQVLFNKSIARSNNGKHKVALITNNVNNSKAVIATTNIPMPNKVVEDKNDIIEPKGLEQTAIKDEFLKSDSRTNNAATFIPQKSNLPDTYPLGSKKKVQVNKDELVVKEYKKENKPKTDAKKKAAVESLLKNPVVKNNQAAKPAKKDTIITKPKLDDEVVVVSSKKKKKPEISNIDSINIEGKKITEITTNKAFRDTTPNKTIVTINRQYGVPGKLMGKVINAKTGDVLSGATVTIKGGATIKTMRTDYNGAFSFSNIPSGYYEVSCTFIGYATNKIDDVKVLKDDVTTQDITMKESKGKDLDDVVVKSSGSGSKKNAETVAALLTIQKNAASVSDGISAEAIKRTPDKNTSDILKRVSGATIQEDKFAIVRGLADRYNAAFVNGAPLPSTESDRKAFSFDIFPANMLDNLTIVKTATPDMPAEFAGGLIFINTKDVPAKEFQSVTFGLGYNTQATFKSRKYYKGGRFDFLGIDDGTRGLSANIPTTNIAGLTLKEKANLGKFIPNDWKILESKFSPNINFQYTRGINIQRKQKDFIGVLLAATYSRTNNTTTGDRRGVDFSRSDTISPIYTNLFSEDVYTTQYLAGLLGNVSIKVNSNNKLSLKNLISVNSDDRVITRGGNADAIGVGDYSVQNVRWFTSNTIISSQFSGEHFLPKSKLKINWVASYSSVNRSIPSLRKTGQVYSTIDGSIKQNIPNQATNPELNGSILYATTKENIKSFKTDLQRTFTFNNKFNIQLKAGAYIQGRQRDFNTRFLGIQQYTLAPGGFDASLLNLDEGKVFDPKNFGIQKNNKGGFYLNENFSKSNTYDASSALNAGYLMFDTRLFKFMRFIGGARIEQFNQKLNSFDEARNVPVNLDTTYTDILPSLNYIISLNSKQNLRFCYSQTLNRPEYRELANFVFYDNATRLSVYGDPNIKRAKIENYDFRYEIYPTAGQLFSISAFYKKIENPTELAFDPNNERIASYRNATEAKVYGAELEARVSIGKIIKNTKSDFLKNLTVFGNLALIQSEVEFGKDSVLYGSKRWLQGQSPYQFNGGLIYQNENGFSSTLQVNKVGQRIFIAGNVNDVNVFENGRAVLDLQIAKIFEKQNLEFKLNIKDILAPEIIFFYDINNNNKFDKTTKLDGLTTKEDTYFSRTQVGRVISASITYKF